MGADDRLEPARPPGARRRARELALAALYRVDVLDLELSAAPVSLPDVLALNAEDWPAKDRASGRLRAEVLEYANDILTGLLLEHTEIDAAINDLSTDWRVDRLSTTDRCILRIALWELRRRLEPPAVIIDEAVELARQYGGADSPAFVNGVLGAWVRKAGEQNG